MLHEPVPKGNKLVEVNSVRWIRATNSTALCTYPGGGILSSCSTGRSCTSDENDLLMIFIIAKGHSDARPAKVGTRGSAMPQPNSLCKVHSASSN